MSAVYIIFSVPNLKRRYLKGKNQGIATLHRDDILHPPPEFSLAVLARDLSGLSQLCDCRWKTAVYC